MRVVAIGLLAGIGFSAVVTRLVAFLLLGTNPLDVASYAGAVALMLAVTAAAMYVPARRAARVDPFTALRMD